MSCTDTKTIDVPEQMHGHLAPVCHDALRAISYLRDGLIPAYDMTVDQLYLADLADLLERREDNQPSLLEILL
jgi:hypothetical protein